jgi:hypothetical protein
MFATGLLLAEGASPFTAKLKIFRILVRMKNIAPANIDPAI